MVIAVGSGKGGTGKTTVATSLALALSHEKLLFLDCDVEAPNAHLFLKPSFEFIREVMLPVPEVDAKRCDGCGRCAQVCAYGAILCVEEKVLTFPALCHGCGSCVSLCPQKALEEAPRAIGRLEAGRGRDGLQFCRGVINVAEPMAVPIIRALKGWSAAQSRDVEIRDLPPGTACSVVESLRGADAALLVTEPTPFGLHDLRLMIELLQELEVPAAVVVNKDGVGDAPVERVCRERGLPVLMRIPLERSLGEALARGCTLVDARPGYLTSFRRLFHELTDLSFDRAMLRGISEPVQHVPLEVVGPQSVTRSDRETMGCSKQVIILSGKGGAGKTSVAAALVHLASVGTGSDSLVVADADVDAANLGLVLDHERREQHRFWGGQTAVIDHERCNACGLCKGVCRFGAIVLEREKVRVDAIACEGCAACFHCCPMEAIRMEPLQAGWWFRSASSFGPLFHAALRPGSENSGKLVTLIKQQAGVRIHEEKAELLIVDGPPGIACPVIAASSGADYVLIVAEPSLAGQHDLMRVLDLVEHFGLEAGVCVNKSDLFPEGAQELKASIAKRGIPLLGEIPFDVTMTEAMAHGEPVTMYRSECAASLALRRLWHALFAEVRARDGSTERVAF